MKTSLWLRRTVILIVAIVVAQLAFRWLTRDVPIAVETVTAERGLVEATATNSRAGTIKARSRVYLSPEIGGTVVELPFRDGDSVQRGDLVLRLDDSLQRSRLEVARGDLEVAGSEEERSCLSARRAEREGERMRALVSSGIVSEDRLDQVESSAEAAAAACKSASASRVRAESAVGLAQAELAKTVIRTPLTGVVADLRIEIGEYSTPSPPAVPVPPAIDILDPRSIYISAPMDEVDSARIAIGQQVRVTVDSHRGRTFSGRVIRVAPYVLDIQDQNRTVEIEVEIIIEPPGDSVQARQQETRSSDQDGTQPLFLPGTSADVEVIVDRHEGVLRIPSVVLVSTQTVWVVHGEGAEALYRVEERKIEVGIRNWDWVEVLSGLEEGELLISSLDLEGLEPGSLIELEAVSLDSSP